MAGLPFLNHKKMASVIMTKHNSDGSNEPISEEGEHGPELMSAADDLLRAINMKDSKMVADALKAAFDICGSHEEGVEI